MDSVNRRRKIWIYALISGILSIIIGILLVIFKRDSLNVILIISGVLLAIDGVIFIIGSLANKSILGIVFGAIFVVFGVAMVILPNLFTDIFMILLAILLIIIGVSGAISAFDETDATILGWLFSAIIAVAMVAAGILILFNLEESADWVMITVGIITILSGTLDLSKAIVAYRVSKRFS